MARGRSVLVAILIYVSLDFALVAMPGAFVFDAADSVDGTQGGRIHGPNGPNALVVPPALSPPSLVIARPLADAGMHSPAAGDVTDCRAVPSRLLARGMLGAPSPSEDPH